MATSASALSRAPRPSSLADVLDLILDKGLVIDAYVRVSLAGIELLTIDARMVVASVDTYLRFAEAVNRLDLTQTEQPGLEGLFGEGDDDGRANRQEKDEVGSGEPKQEQVNVNGRQRTGAGSRSRRPGASGTGDDDQGVLGRIADRARR